VRAESRRAGATLLVAVLATSSALRAAPDPESDAGGRAPAGLEDVLPPVRPLPEHREVSLPAPTEEQRPSRLTAGKRASTHHSIASRSSHNGHSPSWSAPRTATST
jgi:hypothetical protein